MSNREFVEDKVYLQTENGEIWEYEPVLARARGVVSVIPNPSKKDAEPVEPVTPVEPVVENDE